MLDIARAHETADEQAQQIENDRKSQASHAGYGHKPSVVSSVKSKPSSYRSKLGNFLSSDKGGDKDSVKNHSRPSENFMSCTRCGRQGHTHKFCRIAIDKICNKCQHKGHFEKMCRTKDLSLDQCNQSQKSNVSRPKGNGHKNFVKAMAYEEIDSENE